MAKITALFLNLHLSDKRLMLWLDGELLPAQSIRVAQHLDRCEVCRNRLETLSASLRLFQSEHELACWEEFAATDELTCRFEKRLNEEVHKLDAAPIKKRALFQISRRLTWATVLSGICLTFAVAMPIDRARALLREIWKPFAEEPNISRQSPPKTVSRLSELLPPREADRITLPRNLHSAPVAPSPKASPQPSFIERETAEVDARYAMHRVHACMGEQIEYLTDAHGYVVVQGLVDSAARKQELQQALSGIPWLHEQIRTIAEVMSETATDPTPLVSTTPGRSSPSNREMPAAHRPLKLPTGISREQVLEISREAVANSALSMEHAWSFRHLLDAYSESRLSHLPPESRRKLFSMLTEHASEWRSIVAVLRKDATPVLSLELNESGYVPHADGTASVKELFGQAQELDRATRGLFADSEAPAVDPGITTALFYRKASALENALNERNIAKLLSLWMTDGEVPGDRRASAAR